MFFIVKLKEISDEISVITKWIRFYLYLSMRFLPLKVWCQHNFLSVPRRGGVFAKLFSKSNLPRRSFAKLEVVESTCVSSLFWRLGGIFCYTNIDTCFFSETADRGSWHCNNENHNVLFEGCDLVIRSDGTMILCSGTSYKGVCPRSYSL